jgi:hypothetical protein
VAAKAAAGDADRQTMVAMAAYFRAQKRGFAPGYEIEDWIAAEAEVRSWLSTAVEEPRASPKKVHVTRDGRGRLTGGSDEASGNSVSSYPRSRRSLRRIGQRMPSR